MSSKRKRSGPKPTKLEIYRKTGVDIVGVGRCGPGVAALVPRAQAEAWIEANPTVWSLAPFVSPEPKEKVEANA